MARDLLGFSVGLATHSLTLYLLEMAPHRNHGWINSLFQWMITVGILFANLVNYGTNKIEGGWGWRVSLGLAAVPALCKDMSRYHPLG
ncbi:General substrate transporter [Macleaya cordata]|uniref:General substrate transporter n=1 Tax=Macleaya cordata TaxID=56857 RepID=A0A200PXL0_MACCD|nr:General substrate transporter [Macleaya cordata]